MLLHWVCRFAIAYESAVIRPERSIVSYLVKRHKHMFLLVSVARMMRVESLELRSAPSDLSQASGDVRTEAQLPDDVRFLLPTFGPQIFNGPFLSVGPI